MIAFLLQGTYGDIYNFPEAAYTSALASVEDEIAEGESEGEDLEGASAGKRLKIGTADDSSDGEDGGEEEDEQGFPSLAQFVAADDSDDDGGKPQRCVANNNLTPFLCAPAVSDPRVFLPFFTVSLWATTRCVSQQASSKSTRPCRKALALETSRKSELRL